MRLANLERNSMCFRNLDLKEKDIQKLEAFEMWLWRKMEKIKWTDKISNEEVLQMVGEQRSLINTIKRRQKNWIGHVLRGESLFRTVLEGSISGKKIKGRPRRMLLDWMLKRDTQPHKTYAELKEEARHREEWKQWSPEPVPGQIT